MDVAALVISILAVLLSVIVAGWAIYLQWCMYRATTDQLSAIGKENASLAERIATSLGQIHEVAASTRSSLDATVSQLVSGLLGRVGPPAEAAGVRTEATTDDIVAWRVSQAASVLRDIPGAPRIVDYLAGGPRDANTVGAELVGLAPDAQKSDAEYDIIATLAALKALDLLDVDTKKKTVALRPEGRQIGVRLAEERA